MDHIADLLAQEIVHDLHGVMLSHAENGSTQNRRTVVRIEPNDDALAVWFADIF